MALKKKGNAVGLIRQPEGEIEHDQDGSIRGSLAFEGDVRYLNTAPDIEDAHPDLKNLACYYKKVTYLTLSKVRVVCSYIGLDSNTTKPVFEFVGGTGEEAIETHKDFVEKLAGKKDAELNGAKFEQSGRFECWPADSTDAVEKDLVGVQSFSVPRIVIRRSWWQYGAPSPKKLGTIEKKPGGIIVPSSVKNFLVTSFSYRQLGRIYQVSDELTGSGERGWNPLIYPN